MSFVLFAYILGSSILRWGFWEAHLTASIYFFFWIFGSICHHPAHLLELLAQGPLELFLQALLYFGFTCTAGFIAEALATRSESNALALIRSEIRGQSGIEQAISNVCSQGRQLYAAMQILVVTQEQSTNRATLYRSIRSQSDVEMRPLEPCDQFRYLFPEPGESMRAVLSRPYSDELRCHKMMEQKVVSNGEAPQMLPQFLSAHPFRILLTSALAFEDDYIIRVFVVDPLAHFGGFAGLRALHYSMRQLHPFIYDRFLVGRLKNSTRAVVHGLVARELHDGVIQTLSSINMQLEVLRRKSGDLFFKDKDPLEQIQQTIQKEILSLRDFTQHLRALEMNSSQLLSYLAGMAVKFECEHGITTRFIPEVDEVRIAPRICSEVARIVQEGLVNIRKHSQAQEANVHLIRLNGHYLLKIKDNGRGFGFSGKRSHEELQAKGIGPIILMERVRAIGGTLSIESAEGSGACLEITFPA
jgi:signal transduction histidine kinase